MSSFICSPKHFRSVEEFFKGKALQSDTGYIFEAWEPYGMRYRHAVNWHKMDAKIEGWMDTIKELQAICVTLQYKHHYEGTLDSEIRQAVELVKVKSDHQPLNIYQVFSALRCINYQIETEHLEELRELTPEEQTALKVLRKTIDNLAYEIACNTAEEKEGHFWSID